MAIDTIKAWYLEVYPSDECGHDISESVTFDDLYEAMEKDKCVYETMGGGDSVIRERVFQRLSDLKKVDYDVIYRLWLRRVG